MAEEKEPKPRRPRRSKADIEEAIHKAATAQIKKKGFSLALVTDIVKRAKIEPIVFYNRYKNLDEFYDTFVKQYDYWLIDMINSGKPELYSEEGLAGMLENLFNSILSDKLMTELLRWEITEGNHITERTARIRELHTLELLDKFDGILRKGDMDIAAVIVVFVAGLYYVVLHKDRSSFGGVDINTPQGKERIHNACRSIASMFFRRNDPNKQLIRIAANMRAEGIPEDVISRCLRSEMASSYKQTGAAGA